MQQLFTGSQVDIRPIKDLGVLLNSQPFNFKNRRRATMVSRRAVLEDSEQARTELVANLQEGHFTRGY